MATLWEALAATRLWSVKGVKVEMKLNQTIQVALLAKSNFSAESDAIYEKHANGKTSKWYTQLLKRIGSPTGMSKDARLTGSKYADQELRTATWLKAKSCKSGDAARLKARNLFMKICKPALSPKEAGLEWKRLCDLCKNPASAAASIGGDPFIYEGEAIVDSGAADHICGLQTLSKAQRPRIFTVKRGVGFFTANGAINCNRKIRLQIPALATEVEFGISK